MKKRILSLALALAMCVSLIPAASAASLPPTTTKTYKLDKEYIATEIDNVEVTVTLDGYIGELDMKEVGIENEVLSSLGSAQTIPGWDTWPTITKSRPIYVLKSGSNVTFNISKPAASYNYCFDPNVKPDEYGFLYDECAGGKFYSYEFDELDGIYASITSNHNGTATLNAGGIFSAEAKKLSSTKYAYTAVDGLYTFCFNAKNKADSADGESWDPTDSVARYVLGTFLFISEEQVDELEATGTMTFNKDKDTYQNLGVYSHLYPGLAELLGVDVPKQHPLKIEFESDDTIFQGDSGYVYRFSLENTTTEPLHGYYALLTIRQGMMQIHALDVDLKPRQKTTENYLHSTFSRLSDSIVVKLHFDDKSERDAFLQNSSLYRNDSQFIPWYGVHGSMADAWLSYYFGTNLSLEK